MAVKETTTATPKTSTPPASKTPPAPSRPAQATTARTSENAPAPAPKTSTTPPVSDKVDAPQKPEDTKASDNTKQLESIRKNYGAIDAAGDDDGDQDNKVTDKDVDKIQDLQKDGKLDDYLQEQYQDDSAAEIQKRTRETADAARYLDKNLGQLDTAQGGEADGVVSVNDVDKSLTESRKELAAPEQRKVAKEQRDNTRAFNDNFKTFDGANDDGKLDGNVSRSDIQAIADGKAKANQDTREAARYFLENPDRLRALDNAAAEDKSGEGDNKIGQSDVDATLTAANRDVRTMGRTGEEVKAYDARQARLQSDSLNTLSKGYNGDITRTDLQNTANDVNADKDQRDAAQYLLDNPERLNALDTAKAQGGDTDGTISEEDIKAARIDAFNEVRKNPDAQRTEFVKKQQDTTWRTPAEAVENLKRNPDLSSYSDDQLGLLNALSRNPRYKDEIQQATGNYVNQRTNSLDDIPGNMGFQGLLKSQVVDQKELDGLSPESRKIVESAQGNLNGQVDRALSDSLDRNLDGKEGDDEADQALDGFGSDLQGLAEKNPALLDYFKSNSQKLLEDPATAEKIQDVKQADDGFFGDVTNALGGAITDATGWVGDKLGDVAKFGFKYGPLGAPTTLLTEGAAALGWDAPKNVWDDVTTGALDRPIEALVGGTLGGAIKNPTDFAKGIYTISPLKPLVDLASGDSLGDVLKERGEVAKGLGEAFISDYKQTFEENGVAGGLAHIGSDIAVTVLTGGGSKASELLGVTGKAAKALDGAGTAFGRYDDVTTASSRLLTDDVFAKLPEKFQKEWAKELGRETLGNFQGSNIQELGKDNSKFNSDLQNQVDDALARLQSYFATQAA